MSLLRKSFDYLTGSSVISEPDRGELVQNILDRRWAIVIATLCVIVSALVAAGITNAQWPLLWLIADLVLTAARWSVMSRALTGSPAARLQCGRVLAFLTLVWSGVFGIAMLFLVRSGDQGLLVLACVLTVSVSSAITYRNAAVPRTAILAIFLTTFPFLIGIAFSLGEQKWIAFVAGIPLLASLYSLTLQNHRILVRLVTAERKASSLAHTDALTGLPNRLSFLRHQDNIPTGNGQGGYAYLCLDLDGFKQVNDNHGHPAGDLLLKAVAQRLQENMRSGDTAFRIGGDEFIVYMQNARPDECASVAARLIECMGIPFKLSQGLVVTIGCSAGSACFGDVTATASTILKAADEALYQAKAAGKSRHIHAT